MKLRETIWNLILKKRKENELAEFRDELTNRVNERTDFFWHLLVELFSGSGLTEKLR